MAQAPRGCGVEAEQAVAQVLTGLLAVETDGTVACVALTVLSPMRCLWGTWWISFLRFLCWDDLFWRCFRALRARSVLLLGLPWPLSLSSTSTRRIVVQVAQRSCGYR